MDTMNDRFSLKRRARARILVLLMLAGCTAVARVANPTAPACQTSLKDGFTQILLEQEEKPDVADALAAAGASSFATMDLGPRPFALSSPSGADYLFFFEREDDGCLLRLYGRQKGFTSYTNNLTYIATRPLPGCRCEE
jgi:hypothetical protein